MSNEHWHGTWYGYLHHRCRCDDCKAVNKVMCARTREQRYAERVEVDGRLVHPQCAHGTESAYKNKGCRCLPCTAAHSVAMAERRAS